MKKDFVRKGVFVLKTVNIWQTIQDLVINCEPSPGLFNPYSDSHPEWDLPDAPSIRTDNLKNYLDDHGRNDHQRGIDLLLVAEAPGPWGCRFSGVPITSEAQLLNVEFPARGRQSTRREVPFSEYSASIYWRILAPYYSTIFTWNTVPWHPYRSGKPDSIRTPRQAEINQFLPVLEAVVSWAGPRKIVAVGRKAENALGRIGATAEYVRHPSQGGARIFETGVLNILEELNVQPIHNQTSSERAVR